MGHEMTPEPLEWTFLLGKRSPGKFIRFPPQGEYYPFYKGPHPNTSGALLKGYP